MTVSGFGTKKWQGGFPPPRERGSPHHAMKGVARKICSNGGSPPCRTGVRVEGHAWVQLCLHFGADGEEGGWGGAFLEGTGVGARVCCTCLPACTLACTGRASGEGE